MGVRPCVAFLHDDKQPRVGSLDRLHSSSQEGVATSASEASDRSNSIEETLAPVLSAQEVAAVFTAPFHKFLEADENWYNGSWRIWNEQKWRLHNFYVPIPGSPSSPSASTPSSSSLLSSSGLNSGVDTAPNDVAGRYRVFGMTARILIDCARIAYSEDPQFDHNRNLGDEEMIRGLIGMGRMTDETTKKSEKPLTRETLVEASKATMSNTSDSNAGMGSGDWSENGFGTEDGRKTNGGDSKM